MKQNPQEMEAQRRLNAAMKEYKEAHTAKGRMEELGAEKGQLEANTACLAAQQKLTEALRDAFNLQREIGAAAAMAKQFDLFVEAVKKNGEEVVAALSKAFDPAVQAIKNATAGGASLPIIHAQGPLGGPLTIHSSDAKLIEKKHFNSGEIARPENTYEEERALMEAYRAESSTAFFGINDGASKREDRIYDHAYKAGWDRRPYVIDQRNESRIRMAISALNFASDHGRSPANPNDVLRVIAELTKVTVKSS